MSAAGPTHLAPLLTGRVRLPVVTAALARAVLDGRLDQLPDGLRAAPGWPTADTANGLRLSWGHPDAQVSGGSRVVIRRDTDQIIGDLGWKGGPDPDGTVEIGYGLAAGSRGLGYGAEAVGAFVAWALGPGGALTVAAEVVADNLASRRLLERLGFTVHRVAGATVWYRRSQ